ncbi:hypothetical protein PVK06_011792 [Gossypium arboreum]|uniref:Uncharacterized protein n=1 Tax=Gossypium arboreum TaxID=29729 RepID=A0ABR0QAZ2_GOSAR|nr:hypothetical protein PVK06_011792 [Gossypium arboreum]
MEKTRCSVKKATKSSGEHASSVTTVHESEYPRPVLKPSTHSTTITFDRMHLIHFIVKSRKIDVGAILHQEIADCAVRQTGILVFPSLVMLLCQQKGIVPRASEEVLENKGPINEASVERMTRGKDTSILEETKTMKNVYERLIANQEDTIFEKEAVAIEEEVVAEEEEAAENEKEKEEKILLRRQSPHPSLWEVAGDARVKPGTEEQSRDCAKPKEKKMKCSKDKKMKGGEEKEEKEISCSHIDSYG